VFAVLAWQVKVPVPDPARLFPVIDPQVSPNGMLSVRITVSLKPFSAVMVIVDVRLLPVTSDGEVTEIVKSVTVNVAVVLSVRVPLVPAIARVYVPTVVELQETAAAPEFTMLVGVIPPHVNPVGVASVSVTVPANPLTGLMVMVEVVVWPGLTAGGEVVVIVKLLTWKTMFPVAWDSVPLALVTVTV